MALDPEEFKRRRAEREQQRQNKHRGMIVRLVIAGIVLVLCAVLIIALASAGNGADSTQPPQTDALTEQTLGGTAQTEASLETVIHLAAAGDLNINEAVVNAGGAEYDYTDTFLDVAHLLAQADVTALNLEGNLCGPPYGTDRSAPQTMAQALSDAGVDLIQLANSYSIYRGMDGLKNTINGIRLAGMEPVGAYAEPSEAKAAKGYTIKTVQGIKIAFVAFTKGMDGMALPVGNEGCVNVLYTDYATDYQSIDTEGITKILDAAAKEKPDLTVALLHWGSEFNNTISTSQEDICRLLQENGVDAIIGTHSHYVQKMEYDAQSGSFVAYSLGDFLGDAQRAGSEYSVVLDLEITKNNESGDTRITGYSYTPIFTMAEEGRPLKVLRIREAMKAFEEGYIDRVSQESYDAMKYALERIEARVKGE